ncbi:MAG: ABC transporter ATP-binding protein [Bacteroidetes bacterium]|nr:MAG: ABC transporter ATP-binding protein [Bacteroidota bacterium]
MTLWKKLLKSSARDQNYGGDLSLKESLRALRHIPPFLRIIWNTNPWMVAANMVLRIATAGIPVTTLWIGKLVIDEVIGLTASHSQDTSHLFFLLGAGLALELLSSLLIRIISLLDALVGDQMSIRSSVQLIEHAARLDLQQFELPAFYDKLERARQQTTGRTILMSSLLSQAQSLISVCFLIGGLVLFNPWLILLLVVAVLPTFISELHFNRYSYSLARSWTPERRELDYLRHVGAADHTAKEVKIFGLASFVKERFVTLSQKYFIANRKLAIQRAGWGFLFNGLGEVGYYIAYLLMVLQTIAGGISIGDLTFLSGSFIRLRGQLQGILSSFSSIAQNALYLQDFFEFFDIKPTIISPEKPIPFPQPIKEGFVFENVSFTYPGKNAYAVRNLSFTLHAGEKLALVGENGAGKTTLVKLISRLYDPSEGRILLDGHDLREYDPAELRKATGVIFQDFVKFQFTAGENIAVGDIAARQEHGRIAEAARLSLADSVIESLPGKYEQMLGNRFEGGSELSGGQWQKVALGRAYMRDAQLVILDEPTAALDARAEYEVFERFAGLTEGKMAVIISHRFSTVRMADRILVLKNGEAVEIGSHEELLAANGLYAELFLLQAQGYV